MAYDKSRSGGKRGGGSGSGGSGGGSNPKASLVLLPIEISEKEIKVRAKLYNSTRDRLLKFVLGDIITHDAVKETNAMEATYTFSLPPNTLEAQITVETLDGDPALKRSIKVRTDKSVEEPIIGKVAKIKIIGTDNTDSFFRVIISRLDDKGTGIPGKIGIHDQKKLRRQKSDDDGLTVATFAFGKRIAKIFPLEKPERMIEVEIPENSQTTPAPEGTACGTPLQTEPKTPFSARLKEAYQKGRHPK